MYSRKVLLIIMLIIGAFILIGCSDQQAISYEKAEEGVQDLTGVQYENDIVALDGEWAFYWDQLLGPDEIESGLMTGYISVPGSWNKYAIDKGTASGSGYGTYRLTVVTDHKGPMALKLPRMLTAYKLWVNGELIATNGRVGETRETMTPQYLPQVAFFEAQQGNNEIVIQLSNFYHRSGGILERIELGSREEILKLQHKNIANNILVFSCLLFIGAYHLALFFFRKKNASPLYFGIFCMLLGIRTLLTGERFLIYLFPAFSWEIAHKIMTLTFILGPPVILMFFMSVYPAYFHKWIIRMAQIIGTVYSLVVLIAPARIFSMLNPVYQVWTIIVIAYVSFILMRIAIRKEKDSWLILLGAAAALVTALNDIIFTSVWMYDNGPAFFKTLLSAGNLGPVGQLVFAFVNSLLIAKKFSDSLSKEEIAAAKLTEVNSNLDKIVLERTEALMASNEKIEQQRLELEKANQQLTKLSLKDPLTGLWNRRKYDEIINLEWNRCMRHQRPIALMIMDIDYFKSYNDCHGHLAGDECLTKIGETIKTSLSRSTDIAARYGGEEFVVILPEAQKEETIKFADVLREKIEALQIPHGSSDVSSYVTVSIGVAFMVPKPGFTHEDLFEQADKALYQAKAEGRNQVKFL